MRCMYNACMGISKREFVNMWNDLCIKTFGVMSDDLPDFMCIDDYWYAQMTAPEAAMALSDMQMEMCHEMGHPLVHA